MHKWTWSRSDDPYLTKLRTDYRLSELVADKPDDYARALAVLQWVHGLWEHDGANVPAARDPISIIEAARQGQRFRCVEYSIVLAGALCSIGIPTRSLALKTADVETREFGAGHLVNEAYLPDRQTWVMIDGQMGVIPERAGDPLSAVAFRQALADGAPGLSLTGDPAVPQEEYFEWVREYLHYLDVPFDNRVGVPDRSRAALMLVPEGSAPPRVFQRKLPLDYLTYTGSVEEFYPVP